MQKAIIGNTFVSEVVPLIDQAQKIIDICVFDWRWYSEDPGNPAQIFNNAIVRAIRRGVAVRVVTNIQETINILGPLGAKVFKPSTNRLIHPKLMIIDQNLAIIGSHNYTQSAFTTNYEISVLLEKPDCLGDLLLFFNNLFNHG